MRKSSFGTLTAALYAAGVSLAAFAPASAQVSGTTGRIAKFTGPAAVGNSVMFQNSTGNIGIGTTAPSSKLQINAPNALAMRGGRPFMTFFDTLSTNERSSVQGIAGGLKLSGERALAGTDPDGFLYMDRTGKVGFGTSAPQRLLQIGPSTDALFTIEGSSGSPNAGFIRFGDKTGWQLRIGRSRESSGGALNTGLTGSIVTIRDDGAFFLNGFPLLATGVEALCRTLANGITRCQGSSLRYKTEISPYGGGLDVVERLKPIAFTRKHNGAHEVGFGAEDIAAVEPRLTYNDDDGKIEGVQYQLLTTVLVNAVKQQQNEIKQQRGLIEQLESRLARLEQRDGQGASGR
jgi:hypothetical protein